MTARTPIDPRAEFRRGFLQFLAFVSGVAASAALGVPVLGYLLGPILRPKRDQWVELGPLDSFPENSTRLAKFKNPNAGPWDGITAGRACYVRRLAGNELTVFSIHCAHLGCPVHWFEESGLFLCPCHGGTYYADGSRAAGPPPRGLFVMPHKLENGRLWIEAGHLPTLAEPDTTAPPAPRKERPV